MDGGSPRVSAESFIVLAVPPEPSLQHLPVMETGEAGPPGEMTKVTDLNMMSVQGFAGAPGDAHSNKISLHVFFLYSI